jgi:chemotaxis signal transduction protein
MGPDWNEEVEAWRKAFDRSFALPATLGSRAVEKCRLLVVEVAGRRCAFDVATLGGLLSIPRIVPVPSPLPEFLGIVSARGVLTPVYSLAALLGWEHANEVTHKLILCPSPENLALATGTVLGYEERAPEELMNFQDTDPAGRAIVAAMAMADGTRIPILGLGQLVRYLGARIRAAKESR